MYCDSNILLVRFTCCQWRWVNHCKQHWIRCLIQPHCTSGCWHLGMPGIGWAQFFQDSAILYPKPKKHNFFSLSLIYSVAFVEFESFLFFLISGDILPVLTTNNRKNQNIIFSNFPKFGFLNYIPRFYCRTSFFRYI